jgi:carbon monoxide dehydrogenase subunit G
VKVAGTFRLDAPREEVFRAICDPAVLLEVLPGCDVVEQLSETEYRGRITLRLPGAVGSYRTNVRLVDAVAPERAGMDGLIEGAMGSISGKAEFDLVEVPGDQGTPGATQLEYHGSGVVQGPLARLDSRFAERLAESLIAQGLTALDRRLAREAGRAAVPVGPNSPTEGSA